MKINQRLLTLFVVTAAGALLAPSIRAQAIWTGISGVSATTNWTDTANWSTLASPFGADVVFGDMGAAGAAGVINSVVNASGSANSLTFTNNSGSSKFHTILIPAGVSLNNANGLTVGINGSAASYLTTVSFAGAGTLEQDGNALTVKNATSTGSGGVLATLDLSGLSNFVYNASGGTLTVAGSPSTSEARSSGQLNLAGGTNLITVGTIGMALSTGNGGLGGVLNLGAGTNVLYVANINMSAGKANTATMKFPGATGGLRMRGVNGATDDGSRVNIVLANRNNSGSGTPNGTIDLTGGHPLDVKAGTITIGQCTSANPSSAAKANGAFCFDNGVVDATTINLAVNAEANVTTTAILSVGGGTLSVGSLSLVNQTAGTGTGNLTITNGGAVICSGNIVKTTTAGTGNITIDTGALNAAGSIGSAGAPLDRLNLTNATLYLAASSVAPAFATTVNYGGPTNLINITGIPTVTQYPAQFPLIKYATAAGDQFNLGLGNLPVSTGTPYTGYITNNTVAGSVDLVLTAGPLLASVKWQGNAGGSANPNWDTTSLNWLTSVGMTTTYHDGSLVLFDDSATSRTVTLDLDVSPGSITVTNNALDYTLNGGYKITGAASLTKQGTHSLILDNSGVNDFTGDVTVSGGTLQVGNNDSNGNLPANVNVRDDGTLVFARSDNLIVPNNIAGTGVLKQTSGGTLCLAGANTFGGTAQAVNNSILQAGGASAMNSFGAVTIANGSTLDLNGYMVGGQVTVQGIGQGGQGAIINSGAIPANDIGLTNLVLAGNTTINISANRWDLRSPGGLTGNPQTTTLSTGGQPYNLIKTGSGGTGVFGIISATVDPALANIDVQQGTLQVGGNTTGLGNPANSLTIESGATLELYAATNQINKVIVLDDGGTLLSSSKSNVIAGPVNLPNANGSGYSYFNLNAPLALNGQITGAANIYMANGTNTLFINGNSPTYAGGCYLNSGSEIVLNGLLNVPLGVQINYGGFLANGELQGPGITSGFIGIVGGSGKIDGTLDASGPVNPGDVGVAGTLTVGNLIVEGSAALTYDLSPDNTVGGGINDLVVVNGDLTLNGGTINVSALGVVAKGATYRLINYTGNLILNSPLTASSSSLYSFTIDTSVPHQVNLTITGVPAAWTGGSTTDSYWSDNANWGGVAIAAGTTLNFLGNNRLNNTNDLSAGTSYAGIVFNAGSGAFVLNGNSINLGGDVLNKSTNLQTVNLELDLGGALTNYNLNGGSGGLVLASNVVNTAGSGLQTLTAAGGSTTLRGAWNATAGSALRLLMNPASPTNVLTLGGNSVSTWTAGQIQVNQGVVNFGSATEAPVVNDNGSAGTTGEYFLLGNTAGAAATFNMRNGTLNITETATASKRFTVANVATDAGSTAVAKWNQTGGTVTLNLFASGTYGVFLANIANSLSEFDVSGGVFDAGASPIMVATRGTNVMNVSGTGVVKTTGALSTRNSTDGANARAVLNLGPGGTVQAGSLNKATGAGAANVFILNLNGGTLKPMAATNGFMQNLTAANLQAGGVVVDDGGLAITIAQPLLHDSALGAAPDGGLVKNGSGTVTLTGANTYTGATVVNAGTLAVSGAQGTLALTVNTGASLSVGAANTISALTVAGDVIFESGSTNLMAVNGAALTNDVISAANVTYNGTLVLTNLDGALSGANSFKLFSANHYSGAFSAVAPATPGGSATWDLSTLTTDGTLRISGGVNLTPTNIVTTVVGGQLVLSWPTDHVGWSLQVQTNAPGQGLSANWFTIPGTDAVNAYTNSFDPEAGSLFFRMIHQ